MNLTNISKQLEKDMLKYGPLFGDFQGVPWLISPSWFEITETQLKQLQRIGPALRKYLIAYNNLYYEDSRARSMVEKHKPEKIVDIQRCEKEKLPILIRPDMVITKNGFKITEIEILVGGIGLYSMVKESYLSTLPVSKPYDGSIVKSFIRAMEQIPDNGKLERALLVSSFPDRLPELRVFSKLCKNHGYEALAMTLEDLNKIDDDYAKIIWRLFNIDEIDEKGNMPNIQINPPLKQFLQEKAWLGFLHNPEYEEYWKYNLGHDFQLLKDIVAKTWILRKGFMPPVEDLTKLTQSQRQYVTKLSDSWGGRSFIYWPEKTTKKWKDFLLRNDNGNSLYVMQEYQDSLKYSVPVYTNGETCYLNGFRAKLSPFYFFVGKNTELADIGVILRKSRKVHGATDSIRIPVAIN